MDKYDKIIYDKYLEGHPAKKLPEKHHEDLYNLIDYFYKGRNDPDSVLLESVEEVNRLKLMKNTTKGHVWRSVQASYDILKHLNDNERSLDSGNEDDFKAAMQNMYASDRFAQELEKSRDTQNKADFLLVGKDNDGIRTDMAPEDIAFRNWLMEQSKTSHNMREILECFGQFLSHANKLKKEKYFPSVSNIDNVTLGNDLARVLPSEYIGLVIPEMEDYFNYKYATESLLQYENRNKEETGKGGVNLILDISGSMEQVLNPGRDVTKKINIAIGFALAMMKILEEADRRCVLHYFTTDVHLVYDSEVDNPVEGMRKVMGLNPHGSTHIHQALKGVWIPKYEELDAIMVTDGLDETVTRANFTKGDKRLSCLLISAWKPVASALSQIADSFIVANDRGGFEHLVEELLT